MSLHFRVEDDSDGQSPAVLKSLSDRTLVGGGARNFCASGQRQLRKLVVVLCACSSSTRQDHPDAWLMSGCDRN